MGPGTEPWHSGTLAAMNDGPITNSYWVIPGRFAAGEYPSHANPRDTAARLRTLLRAGIDHFIDLTTERDWLEPYAEIAAREGRTLGRGVAYERHPIVDMRVPRSPLETVGVLDAIDAALDDGRNVYLHCWGGVGRTGTMVGCWLVRHGGTGDEALAQVAEWWRGVENACRLPNSPQTREQCAYVRNWTEPAGFRR
ncbi:MAG: hypothetical protein F4Y83_02555 [Acidimicrobiia bacterium]|nr:hypothetical protein [Acidimicrobiia bacterium]